MILSSYPKVFQYEIHFLFLSLSLSLTNWWKESGWIIRVCLSQSKQVSESTSHASAGWPVHLTRHSDSPLFLICNINTTHTVLQTYISLLFDFNIRLIYLQCFVLTVSSASCEWCAQASDGRVPSCSYAWENHLHITEDEE